MLCNAAVVHHKKAQNVSKTKNVVLPVPVRMCQNCWTLSMRRGQKLMPRQCRKCKNDLVVICPGCLLCMKTNNSRRHLKLCEKYIVFLGVESNDFDSKCERVIRKYVREHRPARTIKKKRYDVAHSFLILYDVS